MIVVDSTDRVLLIHQNYGHRRWSLPGGLVEAGESPAGAAIREALEEVGVEVRLVRLGGVSFKPADDGAAGRDVIHFGFLAEVVAGEPHIGDPAEIAEIGWFSAEEWPLPRTGSGPVLLALASADGPGFEEL